MILCSESVHAAAFKVLVFSKTAGYRHASITNGLAAIRQIGTNNNFDVLATEESGFFTDANLSNFAAVVFLSSTGDVLNDQQQAAFERYIRSGGGYVGIHAATDTEYSWPWYGELVGAWFRDTPAVQKGTVVVEDFNHPSTIFLPEAWARTDEWHNFRTNPRAQVHVLCRMDESSYGGGTMGDHPIAWYQEYDGGRAWITALGHTPESFDEPLLRSHIEGGIRYAAKAIGSAPAGALVLFNGRDASAWRSVTNGIGVPWQITNGILTVVPGSGNVRTAQVFDDYLLHVEFRIPQTAPGTAENAVGNSGIFLQGQFEMQIMDSYGRPVSGANETGAIYGQRDPATNASLPAGTWETLDIDFHAPKWNGTTKTSDARVNVWWNGILVQSNQAVTRPTATGAPLETPPPGPVTLQDLVGPVQFRNIWLLPRDVAPLGEGTNIVRAGSAWRYLDDGSQPPTGWRSGSFSDEAWRAGAAQLGYGDGDEATVVRSNRLDNTRIITTYFRREFTATNTWAWTNLELRLLRDDGVIVYLNGVEVYRNNMTNGIVTSTTPASTAIATADEQHWIATNIPISAIREGTNLIATEVHQSSTTSTDVSFDLTLTAWEFVQPAIGLAPAGNAVRLKWPSFPAGFVLESSGQLPGPWTAVPGVEVMTGVRGIATISNGTGQAYFRLRKSE